MKAIICTKYGPPDALQFKEVAKPAPTADEVLVKIHAASVNMYDWHLLTADIPMVRLMGGGLRRPKITIPGEDIAGRIKAAGSNVRQFRPGDEVFGDIATYNSGGFAEYVAVPERALALKPTTLSFEEAAAVPMAATAGPRQQADDAGAAGYLPILIVGIVLVSLVARQMFRRPAKAAPLEPGQSRDYGAAGAAVCRGCGLPFARDVLDLNMLVGKLVRCPHCGKWAVLPAASPAEVAAAEERERQKRRGGAPATAVTPQLSQEEQLRRRIEDSRYE